MLCAFRYRYVCAPLSFVKRENADMRVKVTIRGIPELKRDLDRLSDAAQGRMLRNCTMAGARVAAAAARRNAPVATGRLKKSIKARWAAADRKSPRKEALVNTPLFYGRLVENGTRFVSPQPFMRPAVDENQGRIIDKMAQNLSRGIDRELRRQGEAEDQGEA
jgi:HK97 gp10 family phage protein